MVTVKYCPVLICMQLQLLSDVFIFKYYRPLSGAILFFLCKTRAVLCWGLVHSNSPRVLKQSPRASPAGTESRLRIHSESWAKGSGITYFQASHPHITDQGWRESTFSLPSGHEGWSVCLLTEITPRQQWALLQTDRLQQSTHQLINLCQNSFVKRLPTTSVFWNTLQQDKKGRSLASWPGHPPC